MEGVPDVTDLSSRLIMNIGVPSVLSKTKNPAESGEINMVVSTICHPVNLISCLIIEKCSMKLRENLLIPVILESHDV
jgi:hypothetical protein